MPDHETAKERKEHKDSDSLTAEYANHAKKVVPDWLPHCVNVLWTNWFMVILSGRHTDALASLLAHRPLYKWRNLQKAVD